MQTNKLLIEGNFIIQKQDHAGGWHYVELKPIPTEAKSKMGLIRVSGLVNNYEIKQFNLLPMKNASMMLPLNTLLRKAIQKKLADTVHVRLYTDHSEVIVPDDILDSLLESPKASAFFSELSDANKKYYLDWILAAKTLDTKVNRTLKTLSQLEKGIKFYDWPAKE